MLSVSFLLEGRVNFCVLVIALVLVEGSHRRVLLPVHLAVVVALIVLLILRIFGDSECPLISDLDDELSLPVDLAL